MRDTLLVTQRRQISHPVFSPDKRHIYFSADFSGNFDIWAIDVKSKGLYKVTNSRFGAFAPDISGSGRELIFENYSARGFDLCLLRVNPQDWQVVDRAILREKLPTRLFHVPYKQPPTPDVVYTVQPYKAPLRYLLPHSWGLIAEASGETDEGRIGGLIQANDPLYRFSWRGWMTYDLFRETVDTRLSLRYSRFWPVLGIDAFYDQESLFATNGDTVAFWKELGGQLSITLPVHFSQQHYADRIVFHRWDRGSPNS